MLLIDGYNLLNAAGIVGRGVGPGGLRRARLAMLNFLAESLDPEEVPRTTVVFDAADRAWGLPRAVDHRGIAVRFASEFEDADAMIEELIRTDSAPRRLTVVSSDHRLQRAARRRKARAVDSDVWYAEVLRQRQQRRESTATISPRPPVPLLAEDVEYWLRLFGGEAELNRLIAEETAQQASSQRSSSQQSSPGDAIEPPPVEPAAPDQRPPTRRSPTNRRPTRWTRSATPFRPATVKTCSMRRTTWASVSASTVFRVPCQGLRGHADNQGNMPTQAWAWHPTEFQA